MELYRELDLQEMFQGLTQKGLLCINLEPQKLVQGSGLSFFSHFIAYSGMLMVKFVLCVARITGMCASVLSEDGLI